MRNTLAGLMGGDIDLAGSIRSEELGRLIGDAKVRLVNERLGTCHIITGGAVLEYTPFRTERYRGGEHTPYFTELTDDIEKDCFRRDFACNSLYCDAYSGEVIDLAGGIEDINNKVIRAVVEPEQVFGSDGLRLMRLARQAAELGFSIEERTMLRAKNNAPLIADISAERIKAELDRVLRADKCYGVEDAHYRGLQLIGELGLWDYILPEFEACKGVVQNPKYHRYDVYEHTLQAVRFAPAEVRLAALMHDLGKPVALKSDGNMYRHAEIGAEIARVRLGSSGLKYPNAVVRKVVRLVKLHMYDLSGMTGESKLRRFVAQNHDIVEELCELIHADGLATGMSDGRPCRIKLMHERMVAQGMPWGLGEMALSGADILAIEGIEPRAVGKVLEELYDMVITLRINNDKAELMRAAVRLAGRANDGKGAKK